MYAVVKTGGKQYKVSKGDKITVEKLEGEKGSAVILDQVLMVANGDTILTGQPRVANSAVHVEILEQFKDDTVIVFKKKRRQNYRRKNGHRQPLTTIEIKEIRTTA